MSKKHKVKISPHAKIRFEERTCKEREEFLSLSRSAYRKGLMWQQIETIHPNWKKSEEGSTLKNYMTAMYGRKKKYYKGYIFIFSGTTRKLITMYECKTEYIECLDKFWKEIYMNKNVSKKFQKRFKNVSKNT